MFINGDGKTLHLSLLERFPTHTDALNHIHELEKKIAATKVETEEMVRSYTKKIQLQKRIYSSFPFRKGYKLSTTKEQLQDLFHRFHAAVFELDPEDIDKFVDRMVNELPRGLQ